MAKIKIMDEVLANKIAAGEVVEKTMNVVKELVENSIDAKSSEITIKLIDSGVKEIEVSDNGVGMDRNDAVMAFLVMLHLSLKIWTIYSILNRWVLEVKHYLQLLLFQMLNLRRLMEMRVLLLL